MRAVPYFQTSGSFTEGLELHVGSGSASRIKNEFVPTDDGEIRAGGSAGGEATRGGSREKICFGIEGGHARRNGEMEGVHVDVVALPGNHRPWAVKIMPAKLSMGPVGPCSPGIHSG